MRRNSFLALSGFALLILGIGIGVVLGARPAGSGDLQAALQKLDAAYRIVTNRYVESVPDQKLTTGAITGMLEPLDPHSVYISAERMERVNEAFNASFEGIGVTYELIEGVGGQDTLAVLTVLPDGPSDQAGLQSGDRVLAISGTSAVGLSHEQVQQALKGPEGTTVRLTVRRPGEAAPLDVRITRSRIPLQTVEAAFMANEHTGYIKISRFARTTHREFIKALTRLKKRGMKQLVLDLRGNTGGLMEMAIRVADEFLSEGQLIVTAESRHREFNRSSYASGGGAFETRPIIVLVDEQTASASEIVAGALQDHDRALIIGERTFGKGLVQRQFGLDDGSALRLTISRFHTPSGRLIQTPYGEDRDTYYHTKTALHEQDTARSAAETIAQAPDSLRYRTDGGRPVVGGGGIMPDYRVRNGESSMRRALAQSGVLNAFARRWLDRHGRAIRGVWEGQQDTFVHDFQVSDSLFAAFMQFAVDTESCLAETGEAEGPSADSCTTLQQARPKVEILVKSHLARRLFGTAAWHPIFLQGDSVFTKALQFWPDAESLAVHYPVRDR